MTPDLNQNYDTSVKNTKTENGNILIVTDMKFTKNGIEYYFEPLQEECLLFSLPSIETKDLIPCFFHGTPTMNYVMLRTNYFHHRVYEDSKEKQMLEGDILTYGGIYGIGDPILKIVKFK